MLKNCNKIKKLLCPCICRNSPLANQTETVVIDSKDNVIPIEITEVLSDANVNSPKKNNNYGTDKTIVSESTKEKSKRELGQYINNDYIKNSRDNWDTKNNTSDGIIVNDINTDKASHSSDSIDSSDSDLESCYSHDTKSDDIDSDSDNYEDNNR